MSGAATGGVLAMRAGAKAAGRNAVVGGVVMAAIEGLSLVLNRVLMPMFEKQQMEAGMEIDMLTPPKDPTYISHRRQKREPLFQPNASGSLQFMTPAPSSTNGSGIDAGAGFDVGKQSTFNEDSTAWEKKQKEDMEREKEEESSGTKPFWKIW
jgi:hypothetical protein